MVTVLVVPCSVSLPVAAYFATTFSLGTGARSIGLVSSNVAVGNCAVSMMRPWNCALRPPWSLVTVVMSTLNDAFVTLLAVIVVVPVMSEVRPTALVSCPNRFSFTRYPAVEPVAIVYLPESAGAPVDPAVVELFAPEPGVVDGVGRSLSESFGGGSSWMKWMYTNGPPTSRTIATTTPPMTQRNQERFFGVGAAMRKSRFVDGGEGEATEDGGYGSRAVEVRSSLGAGTVRSLRTSGRGAESGRRTACRLIPYVSTRSSRAHPRPHTCTCHGRTGRCPSCSWATARTSRRTIRSHRSCRRRLRAVYPPRSR